MACSAVNDRNSEFKLAYTRKAFIISRNPEVRVLQGWFVLYSLQPLGSAFSVVDFIFTLVAGRLQWFQPLHPDTAMFRKNNLFQ